MDRSIATWEPAPEILTMVLMHPSWYIAGLDKSLDCHISPFLNSRPSSCQATWGSPLISRKSLWVFVNSSSKGANQLRIPRLAESWYGTSSGMVSIFPYVSPIDYNDSRDITDSQSLMDGTRNTRMRSSQFSTGWSTQSGHQEERVWYWLSMVEWSFFLVRTSYILYLVTIADLR